MDDLKLSIAVTFYLYPKKEEVSLLL